MKDKYDSRIETQKHILRVQELLREVDDNIITRSNVHDKSKLESPEKEILDEVTPRLRELTYGSEEYKQCLVEMKPMLDHHYANNSHHPEYHERGINDMSLIDVVEMLADWKAATERHADGSLEKSLEINKKRFGISDQLSDVLWNTAKELGWIGQD